MERLLGIFQHPPHRKVSSLALAFGKLPFQNLESLESLCLMPGLLCVTWQQ